MKIIVNTFNEYTDYNIMLQSDTEIIYNKEGLSLEEADEAVRMLGRNYNLSPETEIIQIMFNGKEEGYRTNWILKDFQ